MPFQDRQPVQPAQAGSAPARRARPPKPRRPPKAITSTPSADLDVTAATATTAGLSLPSVLRLQAGAGNAAVAAMLSRNQRTVQRREAPAGIPPPPVAPEAPSPQEHPGFQASQQKIRSAKRATSKHKPAKHEADAAQQAAIPPPDHMEYQAKAAKAETMAEAKPGSFDKAAFVGAVEAAVAAQAPKNLSEASDFAESGKADAISAQVKGNVAKGKEGTAKPMVDASAAPPDTNKAVEKPVAPLAPQPGPGAPPPVGAADAMPAKAPTEQTELGGGPAETDTAMAQAQVTEQQLAESNEPEFQAALEAKKEGEAHSETAPAAFRESEAQHLATAREGAEGAGRAATSSMTSTRGKVLQQVGGAQARSKTKDEQRRAEVAGKVKSIFDATKTEVDEILKGIDGLVDKQFEAGEKLAKAAFTADHERRIDEYKDDRYSGIRGKYRWVRDKFRGLPAEANQIYVQARKLYEQKMAVLIGQIADTVGRELTRARDRVAKGRTEITTYVESLPKDLKKVGAEAASEMGDRFHILEESIDDKSQALAEDLANKYVEARNAVDDEIKEMQEANKGLWDKAKAAIKGAIEAIGNLKDLLFTVLSRVAGVIGSIIAHPIRFLKNFIEAVKTGIGNFMGGLVGHLKQGLQDWLFGTLSDAGIEIPDRFDLGGVIQLVLSLLGLGKDMILDRIRKAVPEPVWAALMEASGFVKAVVGQGIMGAIGWISDKVGDLADLVMDKIMDFIKSRVIEAGIEFLLGLLNPVSAFIKACKMIYKAIMWFVDNAARLKDFVDSVMDSIETVVSGSVGAAASMIEKTMTKVVPLLIGGLASLLGVDDLPKKIRSILDSVRKPVKKVVDKLIGMAIGTGKRLARGFRAGRGKQKAKPPVGVAAGPAVAPPAAAGPAAGVAARLAPDRVKGLVASELARVRIHGPAHAQQLIDSLFATYHPLGLRSLELDPPQRHGDKVAVLATASPTQRIELSQDRREVIRLALTMQTRTTSTVAYVSYGDGCLFPASGAPYRNRGGHAERRIAMAVPALMRAIEQDRAAGRLRQGPDDPVPVRIDMNRLPCNECAQDHLLRAFQPHLKKVRLEISGASVWKQTDVQYDFTTGAGIKRLLDAGIAVTPLDIWAVIEQKLRSMGVREIFEKGDFFTLMEWLWHHARTRGEDIAGVQEVLGDANRLIERERLAMIRKG